MGPWVPILSWYRGDSISFDIKHHNDWSRSVLLYLASPSKTQNGTPYQFYVRRPSRVLYIYIYQWTQSSSSGGFDIVSFMVKYSWTNPWTCSKEQPRALEFSRGDLSSWSWSSLKHGVLGGGWPWKKTRSSSNDAWRYQWVGSFRDRYSSKVKRVPYWGMKFKQDGALLGRCNFNAWTSAEIVSSWPDKRVTTCFDWPYIESTREIFIYICMHIPRVVEYTPHTQTCEACILRRRWTRCQNIHSIELRYYIHRHNCYNAIHKTLSSYLLWMHSQDGSSYHTFTCMITAFAASR